MMTANEAYAVGTVLTGLNRITEQLTARSDEAIVALGPVPVADWTGAPLGECTVTGDGTWVYTPAPAKPAAKGKR